MSVQSIWRMRHVAALAVIAGMVACSSNDNGGGGNAGSIALALTPTAATLQAGSSTTVTGTLTRTNYTGTVTINGTATGSGITATAPSQPGAGNSATVELTAASTATPGVDTITVTASGTGVSSVSQKFVLTVLAANGQSFTFSSQLTSVALNASGSVTDSLPLTRTGFTGAVTFAAENLPAGVTATFAQPGAQNAGTVTFNASSTATAGTYTVTLRGTGSGVSDFTLPVTVVVNGTGTGGSFTMSAAPTAFAVGVGASAPLTVTVTRASGYTGAITLSDTLSGVGSSGLSATITPNPIATGDSTATINVTASGSITPGVYSLLIHASGAGITGGDQVLVVPVTVSASTGSAIRLDYSGCTASEQPVYVAYQDGTSGTWTPVTGSGGVYAFNVSSSKAGLAVVTASGATHNTTVLYMSKAEFTAYSAVCATATAGKSATGTYSGTQIGDQIHVALGGGAAFAIATGTSGNYSLSNIADGSQDLLAYDHSATAPGTGDKIVVRRGLNVSDGGVIDNINFDSTEAVAPSSATFTVSGAGAGDNVSVLNNYLTGATCSSNALFLDALASGATTFTAYGVPTDLQLPGDFSQVTVSDLSGTSIRSTTVDMHALANGTVTLPAALTGVTVTPLTNNAYRQLQVAATLPSGYTNATLSYADVAGNSLTIVATPGYLGGSTVNLAAPDLSSLTGFDASWEPAPATPANYTFAASNVASGTACSEGATTNVATMTGAA